MYLVLFRDDLRLHDHPALWHAAQQGPVLPVYVEHPEPARGGAARWWRHHSLLALRQALADRGLPLLLYRGDPLTIVPRLARDTQAQGVYWNRRYAPADRQADQTLKTVLREQGLTAGSWIGNVLTEPWELLREQQPYKVFSPFWKAFLARIQPAAPLPLPKLTPPSRLPSPSELASEELRSWEWLPHQPNWAAGFEPLWRPGELGAQSRLTEFVAEGLGHYPKGRDFPAKPWVSRLSPHLAHGEISPRQIWAQLQGLVGKEAALDAAIHKFLQELGWREFSWHLLYHFPQLPETPLRPEFARFPWVDDDDALRRWQRGQTGYPIVDAGMRELWHTGYLHNRVRMICGSFLVKDLRIPWQRGEAWFWDTLLDADLANNSASWQWVAGCGTDAAPYFRIFNPVLQAQKFDPEGDYVRHWIPELAALPTPLLHQPWTDPAACTRLEVQLGRDYPLPVVDHLQAREQALAVFSALKDVG